MPAGRVRARGFAVGGGFNASSWILETVLNVDPSTPPKIPISDSAFGFGTNGFGFNVAGLAGQVVVVEGSTNLANWTALATNTLRTVPFYFTDSDSTNFPANFYRAWLR